MPLAPTLLKVLNVAPSVAALAVGGSTPSFPIVYAQPATAGLSVNVLTPTVDQVSGPRAESEVGTIYVDGRAPTLQKILVIYPMLPDGAGEANDLSVTVLYGGATAPATGAVTLAGLEPVLTYNSGAGNVTPLRDIAYAVGLAPTLVVDPASETFKEPRFAFTEMIGHEITLALEVTSGPLPDVPLVIEGLAPTLSFRAGWTTVELQGAAVWTDVGPAS